ncbi:MAG: hypothetical protein IGS48_17900 [Oscillatoriales cyanobacterium C42_A2020_001]|nr:hypothetical protein [Leptolyngbyaceae cyanobacterium C42_A2020_001]
MLFRLVLLLAIAGGLMVFTLQNLTPLIPLVFLGIRFPALPLSWWVLGAIAAGGLTTLAIQVLFGLSNFVAGQTVRSRVRNPQGTGFANRWSAGTSAPADAARSTTRSTRNETDDDAAWKDWRGYEAAERRTPSNAGSRQTTSKEPLDDWERPLSDDWEDSKPPNANRAASSPRDRVAPEDLKNFEAKSPPNQASQSGSTYSYNYREPEDSGVGKQEKVVDADYRVIVPPYRSLDEPIPSPPPPPPPLEENADDWFEDTSDEFGDDPRDRPTP